jgi:hypothetical protein
MTPLITQEVAANIAAHTRRAWTYSVPNDTTSEIIIACGFKPFYSDAESKGGSTTIVDVKVGSVAYDVKARDVLNVFTKERSEKQKANAPGQKYFKVGNELFVGRPNCIHSPVRRPNVELENYQGDCQRILTEQIQEYRDYADRTTKEAGCNELRSLLFLYGQGSGYKAIYIEEQLFSTPKPAAFTTGKGYYAHDANGQQLYQILDYSKGSSNFNKRFDCNNQGFLFVWPAENLDETAQTITNWGSNGGFFLDSFG